MEQLELLNYLSESVKWCTHFYLTASLMLNTCYPYDPAILPLPKRRENNSTQFTQILFI